MLSHQPIMRWQTFLVTIVPIILALAWVFYANSGPVQWFDNGYLLTRASDSPIILWTQSHTSHPFYHAVSVLAYRLAGPHGVATLNAWLSIPLAVVVFALARRLGMASPHASLATVGVLLTNNVFWSASKVEVYTLHLLLLLGLFAIASHPHPRRWHPLLLGLLTGLAICTHQLTFFLLVPLGSWVLLHRPHWIGWALPGLLVGLLPHAPAVITSTTPLWDTILNLAYGYQAGHTNKVVAFRFDLMRHSLSHIALLLVSLVGGSLWGLITWPRRTTTRLWWWTATINLVFALSFDAADRFQFFLPGAALFALLGAHAITQWAWIRRHPVIGYLVLGGMVCAAPLISLGVWAMHRAHFIPLPQHRFWLPYRDNSAYFMTPYLKDTSALQFVRAYQLVVPTGAMVIADYTVMSALRSAQVAGLFQDRTIIDCNLLAPDDTLPNATAIRSRDGYSLVPIDLPVSGTPTIDPRLVLANTVYVVRFESIVAPWYHLTPQPLGWRGDHP